MIHIYRSKVGLSHKRGLWIGWIDGLRLWFMTSKTVYWFKMNPVDYGSYRISR